MIVQLPDKDNKIAVRFFFFAAQYSATAGSVYSSSARNQK